MTKRSIAAVILVAAILLIPSCDAETFMRKFGTNVLGGLGGENIGKINEIIEAGVENHDELVSLIVEVSKNPDTSEKLVSSLSSEASDDSIIKVKELFSSDENISQAIDYVEDLTDEKIESLDIPQSVKDVAKDAIKAAQSIISGINGTGEYTPTKGDVAIIQTVANAVQEVLPKAEDGTLELDDVLPIVNETLRMYNTISSSTAFKNVDLQSIYDALLDTVNDSASAEGGDDNLPSKGGEEVTE